jgi:GTP cyclohydrolase I
MSRFVELLNDGEVVLSVASLSSWVKDMVARLGACEGYIRAQFPIFIKKNAPVSQISSLMDYDLIFEGFLTKGRPHTLVTVVVPVTSLCPCSKEIADYGAHNQRSHVTVTVLAQPDLSITDIIRVVEKTASCELYGILKRTDEKLITELAYDNPKFVEDMVRDIAAALEKIPAVQGFKISSENFESIHNHSAYAEIDRLWVSQTPDSSRAALKSSSVSELA